MVINVENKIELDIKKHSIQNIFNLLKILYKQHMQQEFEQFVTILNNIQNTPPQYALNILQNLRRLYLLLPDTQMQDQANYRIADHIMRLKQNYQKISWMLQECIKDVIKRSIQSSYRIGSIALRIIFDTNADYYKHNYLDLNLKYPLGPLRQLDWYEPEVNEEVDVVRPYITSTSICTWTRATVISKENKKYTLKYRNSEGEFTLKELPFFDKLGVRTKDFEWRMNLRPGSFVDAWKKAWYSSVIIQTQQKDGIKRVLVSFRRFSQTGSKKDSEGNSYDGLDPSQDQWIQVLSGRIQTSGKMAKQLCYYSYNSEQLILDETYDILFEKQYQDHPFPALMRTIHTRSLSYINFFEYFCSQRGYEIFVQATKNTQIPFENLLNLVFVISITAQFVPKMGLNQYFPNIFQTVTDLVKENYKILNIPRLEIIIYFNFAVGQRIFSLSQKHYKIHELRKYLILEFLKLNMQKQLIALKLLYDLIRPYRPYQSQAQKLDLHNFLMQNQIFYKIIQQNVHEQILSRSVQLVKYMIQAQIIGWNQIQFIWSIIPHSDLRGRATIQKLIGDISKNFTNQYTEKIIQKLLSIKETDLTIDKLQLLRVLKDRSISRQCKCNILNYLWQLITVKSNNIKQNIEQQAENVFRGFVSTIDENEIRIILLDNMIARLRQANIIRNQMNLFKYFVLSYPLKLESKMQCDTNYPRCISEVVYYLKNHEIYSILLRLIAIVKTNQKIEGVLEFATFLFDKDDEDISGILKKIYDYLGPTDIFLLWARNLTSRAVNFFTHFLNNMNSLNSFQKLSIDGFQAIKTIFLDLNAAQENIRVIRKKKQKAVEIGPQLPQNNTVGTQVDTDFSVLPNKSNKQQILTYIYVLKQPLNCSGFSFLINLLLVVKDKKVYEEDIKFIIKIIVNLDQSLMHRTKQIRQTFLSYIIQDIKTIQVSKKFDEIEKLKVLTYVYLIQQLFSQTEKKGLSDLHPHFSTIQGEYLRIKIINQFFGNEVNKRQPFVIEINENSTLWELKKIIANIYIEDIHQIDIFKYKSSSIEDKENGKSMLELSFYNQEEIRIKRKQIKQIPRHELLSPNKLELSFRFDRIVQNWFYSYSNNKYLGPKQLSLLAHNLWKASLLKQESQIIEIINRFDRTQKGALDINQFKMLMIKKCNQNLNIIWRGLNLSGYRNNLLYKDQRQVQIGVEAYPRKILSNQIVYQHIYKILSNPLFQPVHLNFYRLLTLLETDQILCCFIKEHTKQFLDQNGCLHQLAYGLESLVKQLESNNYFYIQFYNNDGHILIAQKLNTYFREQKPIYEVDFLTKSVIIPNMIKIVNLFIYPLISENGLIRFIKKNKLNHYDRDIIQKRIKDMEGFQCSEQVQRRQLLLQKNQPIQFQRYYQLSYRILSNLIKYYTNEVLLKMTIEIVKLYASIALTYDKFDPVDLLDGLKCQSLNYRRSSQNIIYLYLQTKIQKSRKLLEKMILAIPMQSKSQSTNYFTTLKFIIQKIIDLNDQNQQNNQFLSQIGDYFFQKLWQTGNEKRGYPIIDRLIQGILHNILILVQKRPLVAESLAYHKKRLIQQCLFFYNYQQKIDNIQLDPKLLQSQHQPELFRDYVKCKSQENRKILMEIIFHLHKNDKKNQDQNIYYKYIAPILNDLQESQKKIDLRSIQVGLNNLGSTCYMNAMLQVLNSIDAFRNAIMQVQVNTPVIKELKSLFSYLYFSQRVDYIPKNLLTAFVPPINPGIQQDTTQFLNFLFDQIDHSLKPSPYRKLLEELFRGNQVAQMICNSCGAKRERIEQFFTYGVEIEGKFDLTTALEGMYAGQLISDCLCESCGQRSDTTKRNILNQIPNIFFVHLKRIVFNYDVFINTKIHTRLYFPQQLNLEPYTKQGLELRQNLGVEYMKSLKDNEEKKKYFEQLTLHSKDKDYYKLKLKGIIIHSGTPDVGHYYAILKRGTNWYRFDDSSVTCFPMSSFQEECYGGNWVPDEWGGFGSSKNAYVLIYQKQLKKDIRILEGKQQIVKSVPYKQFNTYNTVEWYKNVWVDNHLLMIEQHLILQNYSKQFLNFISHLLEISPSSQLIEIISQIIFKVSILSGETGNLLNIFNKNIHQITPQIFHKYILSEPKRTFNFLFHNSAKIRQFACSYIAQVLISCLKGQDLEVRQNCFKFIKEYYNHLYGEAAKNWLRIDGYFMLFQKLVGYSLQDMQLYTMFVRFDFITHYIDLILQKQSPLNFNIKKYSIGTKSNPVNFWSALKIIQFFLKYSYGFTNTNYLYPPVDNRYLFHLSDNSVYCLSSMVFYEKMLKQNQNIESLSNIIYSLSIQNYFFSLKISRVLLKCLNEVVDATDQFLRYTVCMSKYLNINDRFSILRYEALLGSATPYISKINLMSSLDDEKNSFISSLEDIFPIDCVFAFAYIHRSRNPLGVFNLLKMMIECCVNSQTLIQYILKQPAINYLHLRYIDWMNQHINNFILFINVSQKKKEEILVNIGVCNTYLNQLYKFKQPLKPLMVGAIVNQQLFESYQQSGIQLKCFNVAAYGIQSLPTGVGNLSVDMHLSMCRLEKKVSQSSNILKLFKQYSKNAIKTAMQQQKQMQKMFDTGTKANQANKKEMMQIEQPSHKNNQDQFVKEPLSKIEQQGEQQIEANLDLLKIYPNYLRKLQIKNKSEVKQIVNIFFIKSQNNNSTLPNNISFLISPNGTQTYYYNKNDFTADWGGIEYKISAMQDKKMLDFYRVYKQEMRYQPQNEVLPEINNTNDVIVEQNIPIDDFKQIQCGVCTYFNISTTKNCEMCGNELN